MALYPRLCVLSSNARVVVTPLLQGVWTGYGRSSIRVADRPQGHEGRLLNNSSLNGIRTFCTNQDLASKKCVPCSSKDLRPMTEETANILLKRVPGWNLVKENDSWKLHQSWKVKTFAKGMEFLRLVADVAEGEGHHPDLHLVGWNNIKIDIWTHAVGGLTENDFILAAKINGLNLHNLLRITPTDK
ncbi:pterin-4-alpha-carbinolamine dehydratase 2, mitochondrial isoform X1 [Salvia hispanica]|uniref:pterin-4-alpha-carbinolamine dehydratase 2, mitochondrial isoform X1 n=1 Tax=Salvia hispanica TaxID=49212 RepID=UPI0020090E3C|nr:pterin-4-alpha-carbinolamine dehydratase 2, mitochondrial isoform X1 [Salvia hispanica]